MRRKMQDGVVGEAALLGQVLERRLRWRVTRAGSRSPARRACGATSHSSSAVSGSGVQRRTSSMSAWPPRNSLAKPASGRAAAERDTLLGRVFGHCCLARAACGLLLVVRAPLRVVLRAVEQRIADAEVRLGRAAGLGELAQRFERGDRRQHGDRLPRAEPGNFAVVGELAQEWQSWAARVTSTLKGRLVSGPDGTISRCLPLIRSSTGPSSAL